jgi:hypothetical protein
MTRQNSVDGRAAVLRVQRQGDPVSDSGVADPSGLVHQPAGGLGLEFPLSRGDQIAVTVLKDDTPLRQASNRVFRESRSIPIGPAIFLDQRSAPHSHSIVPGGLEVTS